MIIIGLNHNGQIMGIVSAADKKAAMAYWQGKGTLPYSEEIWDFEATRDNEQQGFVTPILETEEKELKSWKMADYKNFLIIK